MLYLQLFWTYLKIGTFTIGGGYVMLSMIEREIVDRTIIDTTTLNDGRIQYNQYLTLTSFEDSLF